MKAIGKVRTVLMCLMMAVCAGACLAQKNAAPAAGPEKSAGAAATREDAIKLARTYMQAGRMAIVARNLELQSQEAGKFWPVYDKYQDALEPLRDRFVKLLVSYSDKFDTLAGNEATDMIKELLDIQQKEIDIRREYLPKFSDVLPAKKVARFYQIDNKINAEIRYSLSLEIPLLETE